MYTHDVPQGYGEHVIGVTFPEIFLGGKGKFPHVMNASDFPNVYTVRVKAVLVKGHIAVHPVQGALKTFDLQLQYFITRHCFVLFIVYHRNPRILV